MDGLPCEGPGGRRSRDDNRLIVCPPWVGCSDAVPGVPWGSMRPAKAQALDGSLPGTTREVRIAGRRAVGWASGAHSSAAAVSAHCLRRGIMRRKGTCGQPRWRTPIAMTVAVLLLALVGHSGMLAPHSHEPHLPHPLVSSVGGEFAVNADHAHLVNDSTTRCHEVIAAAVLSRAANPLVNLGTVSAAAVTAAVVSLAVAVGRGPPRVHGLVLTGQELLTRFCLARR